MLSALALLGGACAGARPGATRGEAAVEWTRGACATPTAPQTFASGARVTLVRVLEAHELSLTELEGRGAQDVTWTHRDQTHTHRGAPLGSLVTSGVATRADAVLVQARDGYHAVFSAHELDAQSGATRAFLVWSVDGQPLSADEGPLRLVVPTDASGARSVRQLARLSTLSIEPPAR